MRILIVYMLFACQLIALSVFAQTSSYDPQKMYSTKDLKADLQYARQKLEKIHPNLYRYTSASAFNTFFDSLDNAITQPMSEQQFLGLITLLQSKTGDGHTMFLPSQATMDYDRTISKFLPFTVTFLNNRLYILKNSSRDSSIQRGEEILSINGTNTDVVLSQLMIRQVRDGYNQTYPAWILNHYFGSYYSYVYGHPEMFSIELKNNKGVLHNENVAALARDSIRYFSEARYPTTLKSAGERDGISLKTMDDKSIAILTIKTLDPDVLKSIHKRGYKNLMDSIFTALKVNQIESLILDLRDNQGGDFETGRLLLSYLFTTPARYLLGGSESRMIEPKDNHFAGNMFVLVNGGSFSNTAIVSACLERDQRAVLIGEETGGNKHIISGDPAELSLPKTKIQAFISSATYRIIEGNGDGHGIMPAYIVHPLIEDILAGNDIAMEMALKLVSKH